MSVTAGKKTRFEMSPVLGRASTMAMLALALCLAISSCHRIKGPLGIEPSGEIAQKSRAISVIVYETSVDVKAGIDEIADYFLKDLSWVEKVSSAIDLEFPESEKGKDMSRVGEVLDFNFRILGINFPSRMINLKFDPEKDLWLMILSGGTWMMWRVRFDPIPGGNRLNVDIIGQPSRALGPFMDSIRLVEAGSARFDMILTFVQAEFDPAVEPPPKPASSPQGEIYFTLFQGYESSLWIDADPDRVREWFFANPGNLKSLIPMVELQGACADNPEELFSQQRMGYCPAVFRTDDAALEASALGRGLRMEDDKPGVFSYDVWIVILDIILRVEVSIQPKAGGSLVKVVASSELPQSQTPEATDLIIGISEIPRSAETVLMRGKKELEKYPPPP